MQDENEDGNGGDDATDCLRQLVAKNSRVVAQRKLRGLCRTRLVSNYVYRNEVRLLNREGNVSFGAQRIDVLPGAVHANIRDHPFIFWNSVYSKPHRPLVRLKSD